MDPLSPSSSPKNNHNDNMPAEENITRVLIVDDDEEDFFITSEYIKNIEHGNFKIDWCFKYKEALQKIKETRYDIYFVDYYLGAKTGLDLLKESCTFQCEEPIVLLTGKGTQAIDKQAMQAGAMDYLVKSELNTEKLERCIRYSLERTSALKALRANERKYRNIFERSKDAVFLATDHLEFKDVNTATCQLLQYSKSELYGMDLYVFMENERIQAQIEQQLQATGEVNDLEVELLTKTEEKKNCILFLSKDPSSNGENLIHGILHDITHLKKAEKATLQAEKQAATGRLVRTLAHEVRNPLNNINLSVEQLFGELQEKEEYKNYLEIIQRNSYRIGDLITELLNTSRPVEMVMKKTPLQEIMDESITAALDRITLQRITMKVHYPNEPAWILADKEKLYIAFLNIIINAVEAMEEETGRLELVVESETQKHIVKIIDNGCGISEESLAKLFEPYFTSKRNGMGLGLAASLNVLQSHKAHIEVSSAINKGTTFTISFPAV